MESIKPPYENNLIGQFLLAVGLQVGHLQGEGKLENPEIWNKLTQQTPDEGVGGDLFIVIGSAGALEFKRFDDEAHRRRETKKWNDFLGARGRAWSPEYAQVSNRAHFYCYQTRGQPGRLFFERYWDAIPAPSRDITTPPSPRPLAVALPDLLSLLIGNHGASADELAEYLQALHPFRAQPAEGGSGGGGVELDVDVVGVSYSEKNGLQFHDNRQLAVRLKLASDPPAPASSPSPKFKG